jgi:hypothetical protein
VGLYPCLWAGTVKWWNELHPWGRECDRPFFGGAIDRYLAYFDKAARGYDLSYLRYYFNDSYEVMMPRESQLDTGSFLSIPYPSWV